MKHTVESLKRNFTLAELWELEKELREKMELSNYTYFEKKLIEEILGSRES